MSHPQHFWDRIWTPQIEICPNPMSFHQFGCTIKSYRPEHQCCTTRASPMDGVYYMTDDATLTFGSITCSVESKSMKTYRIWTDLHLRSPNPVSKVLGVVHNPSYVRLKSLDLTSMTNMWGMMIDVTRSGFWLLNFDVALKLQLRPRIRTDLVECFTKMPLYVA